MLLVRQGMFFEWVPWYYYFKMRDGWNTNKRRKISISPTSPLPLSDTERGNGFEDEFWSWLRFSFGALRSPHRRRAGPACA
jgi:hypothetical protein